MEGPGWWEPGGFLLPALRLPSPAVPPALGCPVSIGPYSPQLPRCSEPSCPQGERRPEPTPRGHAKRSCPERWALGQGDPVGARGEGAETPWPAASAQHLGKLRQGWLHRSPMAVRGWQLLRLPYPSPRRLAAVSSPPKPWSPCRKGWELRRSRAPALLWLCPTPSLCLCPAPPGDGPSCVRGRGGFGDGLGVPANIPGAVLSCSLCRPRPDLHLLSVPPPGLGAPCPSPNQDRGVPGNASRRRCPSQGWPGEALLRLGCPGMGATWDRATRPGPILRGEGWRWGRRPWGGRC